MAYLEIWKGRFPGYISGVHFQKCSKFNIKVFFMLNISTIFSPPKRGQAQSPRHLLKSLNSNMVKGCIAVAERKYKSTRHLSHDVWREHDVQSLKVMLTVDLQLITNAKQTRVSDVDNQMISFHCTVVLIWSYTATTPAQHRQILNYNSPRS